MQNHGGAAAAKVIEGSVRKFGWSLMVDWNRNGLYDHDLSDMSRWVVSASTDRAIEGSVPDEVLLVEGSAVAELTTTLSGNYAGTPLSEIFSPFNTASPLYGLNKSGTDLKFGLSVEVDGEDVTYDQFHGELTSIQDVFADSVSFRCLDRAEKMRVPVRFPAWAISEENYSEKKIKDQLAISHWAIDACLDFCDVSSRDIRPVLDKDWIGSVDPSNIGQYGTKFWMNCNGSVLPSIGWMDNSIALNYVLDSATFPTYAAINNPHPAVAGEIITTNHPLGLTGVEGADHAVDYDDLWTDGAAFDAVTNPGTLKAWVSDRDQITKLGGHYVGVSLSLDPAHGGDFMAGLTGFSDMPLANFYQWGSVIDPAPTPDFVNSAPAIRVRSRLNAGLVELYTDWMWHSATGGTVSPYNSEGGALTIPAGSTWAHFDAAWSIKHTDNHMWSKVWLETDVGGLQTTGWVDHGTWTGDDFSTFSGSNYFSIFDNPNGVAGLVFANRDQALTNVRYSLSGAQTKVDNLAYSRRVAKYAAVLDQGLNKLSYTPEGRSGQDAWDVVSEVAAAEFGVTHWDEHGIFRFWNFETMQDKQGTVVREFTTRQVGGLSFREDTTSVRNTMSASLGSARAQWGVSVYEADGATELYCPAASSVFFTVPSEDKVQMIEPAPVQWKLLKNDPNNPTSEGPITGAIFPHDQEVTNAVGYPGHYGSHKSDGTGSGAQIGTNSHRLKAFPVVFNATRKCSHIGWLALTNNWPTAQAGDSLQYLVYSDNGLGYPDILLAKTKIWQLATGSLFQVLNDPYMPPWDTADTTFTFQGGVRYWVAVHWKDASAAGSGDSSAWFVGHEVGGAVCYDPITAITGVPFPDHGAPAGSRVFNQTNIYTGGMVHGVTAGFTTLNMFTTPPDPFPSKASTFGQSIAANQGPAPVTTYSKHGALYPPVMRFYFSDTAGDSGRGDTSVQTPDWLFTNDTTNGFLTVWDDSLPDVDRYTQDAHFDGRLLEVLAHLDSFGNTVIQINNKFSSGVTLKKVVESQEDSGACRIVGTEVNRFGALEYRQYNAGSVAVLGVRNIEVSSDWLQEYSDSAAGIFNQVLSKTGAPIPASDDITVPGDPRIQLGDTIRVTDTEKLGTVKFQIVGITRDLMDGKLTDTYRVECAEPIAICS